MAYFTSNCSKSAGTDLLSLAILGDSDKFLLMRGSWNSLTGAIAYFALAACSARSNPVAPSENAHPDAGELLPMASDAGTCVYRNDIVCFGSDPNTFYTYLARDGHWIMGQCPTMQDFSINSRDAGYCPDYEGCGPLSPEFLKSKGYDVGDAGFGCCFAVATVGFCGIT